MINDDNDNILQSSYRDSWIFYGKDLYLRKELMYDSPLSLLWFNK